MGKMSLKDAVNKWVEEMNTIPQSLIEKAYGGDRIDGIYELTPTSWIEFHDDGTRVPEDEIDEFIEDNPEYQEKYDDMDYSTYYADSFLPMWGWMWMPHKMDEDWIRENINLMDELGFRVYEIEEGLIFGIDGAGYDFYEAHWTPFYKARGLQWHSE